MVGSWVHKCICVHLHLPRLRSAAQIEISRRECERRDRTRAASAQSTHARILLHLPLTSPCRCACRCMCGERERAAPSCLGDPRARVLSAAFDAHHSAAADQTDRDRATTTVTHAIGTTRTVETKREKCTHAVSIVFFDSCTARLLHSFAWRPSPAWCEEPSWGRRRRARSLVVVLARRPPRVTPTPPHALVLVLVHVIVRVGVVVGRRSGRSARVGLVPARRVASATVSARSASAHRHHHAAAVEVARRSESEESRVSRRTMSCVASRRRRRLASRRMRPPRSAPLDAPLRRR